MFLYDVGRYIRSYVSEDLNFVQVDGEFVLGPSGDDCTEILHGYLPIGNSKTSVTLHGVTNHSTK